METKDMLPRGSSFMPNKLTDWKKEPSLLDLKNDLEAAKPSHDAQVTRIKHWQELLAVKGKAKPPEVKGRSKVQPKLIRRQAEWRYSALTEPFLGSNRLFKVDPVTFEDADAAKQNQLVLNWQFRTKLNRVSFIDNYVRATVDEGTSIVRLGWKRVEVPVQEEVPVYSYFPITSQDQLIPLQQAMELQQADPRTYDETVPDALKRAVEYYGETGQPTFAQQTGTQMVTVQKLLENRPTVEVLNPENVYIDPSCNGDMDKALFAVISFETNKADLLKEGKRYKNLTLIDWESNSPLATPDHATTTPQDFQFKDASRKKVVAYEYWGFYDIDGDGTLQPIVATWIGNTIIRMEKNPFPDQKIPLVVVPYLPIKRDLYGEPDAELLEDNQAILGAVTRGMIDLLGRSANGQTGVAKGMLDPLNKRRYDAGQDYEFNPQANPAANVIEHKYPELPQSALLMAQLQNQDAESITGVKSFSGGVSGEAYGDVAAGIRGALDAASKREMAILRRLAQGMQQIGTKIISMNAVFLSDVEVVRVTNTEFVPVKREDIQGNFDLEVDISTAEVDNAKSQDLAFMLQTLGPKGDPGLVFMILADICDLKRMPELAEKLRTYQPKLSPEQQEMAKLEIEKQRLENAKLQSEIELNQAKAEFERSRKDQADLDFVEQETGTKHARDMQKQQGQAEGNKELEVTKALLKPRKQANGGESKPDIQTALGYNAVSSQANNAGQPEPVPSTITRDELAVGNANPQFNLGSSQFDPSLDPSLNPALNF